MSLDVTVITSNGRVTHQHHTNNMVYECFTTASVMTSHSAWSLSMSQASAYHSSLILHILILSSAMKKIKDFIWTILAPHQYHIDTKSTSPRANYTIKNVLRLHHKTAECVDVRSVKPGTSKLWNEFS